MTPDNAVHCATARESTLLSQPSMKSPYEDSDSPPDRKDSVENREWLELFRPFMAVKNLYLSENLASLIVPALQELVEGRTSDVLPALRNIFLKGLESSGSVQASIGKLVAARQAANHPIVISPWTDSEESEDD